MAGAAPAVKPRAAAADEPAALDLLEEAAYLLRRLPATAVALYFAGTVPMVLGFLFFVADMARAAHARVDAPATALGMVALFIWMKTAQAVAAEHALATLEQRAVTRLGIAGWCRLAAQQLRVHAWGLGALPLAVVAALPLGWVYAFFQSATALGVSAPHDVWSASWKQARLWPLQNHRVLAVLALLAFFVFFNVALALSQIPGLLHSFLGVSLFMGSTWHLLNTTFLAVAVGLTFLVVDPLCKVTYLLRCFYGHARHTGIDLLVRARSAARPLLASVLLGGCLLFAAADGTVRAADQPLEVESGAASGGVVVPQLDAALDDVLASREYSWRLPREEGGDERRGLLARFAGAIEDAVKWLQEKLIELLKSLFRDQREISGGWGGGGLGAVMNVLLYVLIALLVVGLLWFAWRWWSEGKDQPSAAVTAAVAPVLEDENVTADQLPENEWLRLARELLARGDVRLALRAFFLATLAALAARGLLVLARHKSNHDYERELARRGGAAGLTAAFTENRRVLERAWYGREIAGDEAVRRFEANVQTLLGGGA